MEGVMLEKSITITLPETTFYNLKQAAQLAHSSVNEMVTNTINIMLATSPSANNEWAAMHLLSDKALWQATEPILTLTQQKRLHALNHLAGQRALTGQELDEQTTLLDIYQQSIVRRSQALAILKLRGHSLPQDNPTDFNE